MSGNDIKLKALVIDDSPTDAQTLSYLLGKRLACEVEIANDGLEGLDKLSSGRFDLAFLDLEMPLLNGVEVLREIRSAPATASLPVIIISSNTDATTVRTLLEMRVFDYVIKPYNAEHIVKRFTEKLRTLRSRSALPSAFQLPGESQAREAGKSILLVADEDNNFRHFFSTTLATQFHVIEANNGARALALAAQHIPDMVFVSAKLGVFNRDRLVAKFRDTPSLRDVRVVAIDADGDAELATPELYAGRLRRAFLAEPFKDAIAQLVQSSAGSGPVPESKTCKIESALLSAVEQIFGMMLSCELTALDTYAELGAGEEVTQGTIHLFGYGERVCLTVRFNCTKSSLITMAMRMLMMEEAEAAENIEMAHSNLAEILNMVGGRINQSLEEEGRCFYLGLPRVANQSAAVELAGAAPGFRVSLVAAETIRFNVDFSSRPLTTLSVASGDLTDGMALSADLHADSDHQWGAGTLVNGEMIAAIQAIGIPEVEIFEPLKPANPA